MARAGLQLGVRELATAADVSAMTVTRFENGHSKGYADTVEKIRFALESAGVIFVAENGEGPGVRLRKGVKPLREPQRHQPMSDGGKAKRVRVRALAEAAVNAAFQNVDTTDEAKASRKGKLTQVPRSLKKN